jgi:excisionase family DNA binding protein
MVALGAFSSRDHVSVESRAAAHADGDADWLTVQQAACELGVAESTVRRVIRQDRLPHRRAPRRGRATITVYMPGSRHAAILAPTAQSADEPVSVTARIAARARDRSRGDQTARDEIVVRLERQVGHLSEALSRTLRMKQRQLPAGVGQPDGDPRDPYERYRWLTRHRRWWPFS